MKSLPLVLIAVAVMAASVHSQEEVKVATPSTAQIIGAIPGGTPPPEQAPMLGLGHAPNGHWLMDAAMTWTNNKLDDKRFQEADLSEIRKREHYYEYYVPN